MSCRFSRVILTLCIVATCVTAQGGNCVAFSSDGSAASYWQNYRLFDFRNISSAHPQTLSSSQGLNQTTLGTSWTDSWSLRNYTRGASSANSIPVDFTSERVEITQSNDNSSEYATYLTLSTARINKNTQEGGEVLFNQFNVSYASIRVLSRVRGSYGAVAGIFTYHNDTQEADIEMLTRSPANYIQYSDQPTDNADTGVAVPGASVNLSMPNSWQYTDWHVHRLDWTPGRTTVFVDDVQLNTSVLNVPAPTPASAIIIDMWSANSSFSGNMPIGGSAHLDIQWVELLFNSSTTATILHGTVCAVGSLDKQAEKKTSAGSSLYMQVHTIIWSILVGTSLVLYLL